MTLLVEWRGCDSAGRRLASESGAELAWTFTEEALAAVAVLGRLPLADLPAAPFVRSGYRGRSRARYRIVLDDATSFLVKVYRARSVRKALFSHERPGRARREWTRTLAARRAGVPTVLPVAWASSSRWPLGREVIVYPYLDEAHDLGWLLSSGELRGGAREEALAAAGRLVRRAHDAGVALEDLHPGQILFVRDRAPLLVDLERARVVETTSRWRRVRDLARFDRGLVELGRSHPGSVGDEDRRSFLASYGALASDQQRALALARHVRRLSTIAVARRDRRRSRRRSGRLLTVG